MLAWRPPRRVVLSWHITPAWTYEPDPAQASRVEVTFHDLGDGTTRVDLLHDRIERHGKGWEQLRDVFRSEGGWPGILRGFVESSEASR